MQKKALPCSGAKAGAGAKTGSVRDCSAMPLTIEIPLTMIRLDDNSLVKMFQKLRDDIQEKKRKLDSIAKKKDKEGDYLSLLLARLSYGFTKEEYEVLFSEIERRGITI